MIGGQLNRNQGISLGVSTALSFITRSWAGVWHVSRQPQLVMPHQNGVRPGVIHAIGDGLPAAYLARTPASIVQELVVMVTCVFENICKAQKPTKR